MRKPLALAGFTMGLFALSCGEQSSSLTPPDPSFARGGNPSSCLQDAEKATGSVFAGSFKKTFNDLLDANNGDGKISEGDAFQAAIRISIAFDPKEGDFWSNDQVDGDPDLADWANSLSRNAGPADAAELVRLIFKCAVEGDEGVTDTDSFDSAPDWTGFDFSADGQFEADIEKALTRTGADFVDHSDFGAFAVRNPLVAVSNSDPLLESNAAVTSPDDSNGEPYWGVEPQSGESWSDVFGATQQVLIFGFADDPAITNGVDADLEGGSYSWNVLPQFSHFESDVVVGTCQAGLPVGPSQGQANTVRILRQRNVTTEPDRDPSFCTAQFRLAADGSLFSFFASAVGRIFRPAELHAGSAVNPGGRGGLAINWSTFDVATIGQVELVFVNQPCKDQLESTETTTNFLDFEPCEDPLTPPTPEDHLVIRAQTVTGLSIEEICISVDAVDNNGTGKNLVGEEGDTICPQVDSEATARTVDDGSGNAGEATFDPMFIEGRGGFRLRASADFFPDADSDGFNVRPIK